MVAERVAWMPAVAGAMKEGRAVVVLESTVIAQGLPWPSNLETARAMESAVRQAGAEPATVAVLGGRIRIGLTDPEFVEVARSAATETPAAQDLARDSTIEDDALARSGADSAGERAVWAKANRRDLAAIVASGRNAATTVSATLWIARRFAVGHRVMATGGLGGVHRDAAISFDLSTDLDELARADGCLVVCSGMKSILDLSATLRVARDPGRPRRRLSHGRTARLPGAIVRVDPGAPRSTRPPRPRNSSASIGVWGCPGRSSWSSPCPSPKPWIMTRSRTPSTRRWPMHAIRGSAASCSRPTCSTRSVRRPPVAASGPTAPPGCQRPPCRRGRRGTRLAGVIQERMRLQATIPPMDELARPRLGNSRGGSGRAGSWSRPGGRNTHTLPLIEFEALDHILDLVPEDEVVIPLGERHHDDAPLRVQEEVLIAVGPGARRAVLEGGFKSVDSTIPRGLWVVR